MSVGETPLRYLAPHLIEQLMTIDYHSSMPFAATSDAGGAERFIALGRYGATAEPATVELAITVADAWQRQGLAKLLIERLVEYAAGQGVCTVIGWVLYENTPMLELARACGFKVRIDPGHGSLKIIRMLGPARSADALSPTL